jgi:hypothetical protein
LRPWCRRPDRSRLDLLDDAGEFVEQRPHRGAAIGGEFARHEVDRLDAVGALIDRGDARVAIMLGGAGLLDEAHAAMDLHAEIGHLVADVGGEAFAIGVSSAPRAAASARTLASLARTETSSATAVA